MPEPGTSPAALARLHARCFDTPRPWNAAEFADFLASPLCFLATCEGAEGLTGFVLGRAVAGEAELLTVAVSPDCRRQGIGRALLGDFATLARNRQAESAFLEVAEDNAAARALYTATGWAVSGRRPRYYHAPDGQLIDAILMALPLTPPKN